MTKETISETAALKALLSETADHQILAEMLGFVADRFFRGWHWMWISCAVPGCMNARPGG